MTTVNDKLEELRGQLAPMLEELLASQTSGGLGLVMGPAMAFARPQLELWVDEQLDRPPDELDALIDHAIDRLAALRSDDRPALIARSDGAHHAIAADLHDDSLYRHDDDRPDDGGFALGDPVRAPAVPDGGDPDR